MPVTIGSNIASLRGQRQLSEASAQFATVAQRLSSGSRINRASDDAASLAIAESLKTNSRVFGQAIRNVNDGISAIAIQDGALEQLATIIIRQQELAEQAANGVYSFKQRTALSQEAIALTKEYNRIVESVEFNGRKLMEDAGASFRIQAGYGIDGSVAVSLGSAQARTVGTGSFDAFVTYAAGIVAPSSLATGDINNDGYSDFLVGTPSAGGRVVPYLGNANGTFTVGTTQVLPNTNELYLEDLDRNGTLDLIGVMGGSGFFTASGNGDGTFTSLGSTFVTNFRRLSLGDVNNDNKTDIVALSNGSVMGTEYITPYLGNGNGTFTTGSTFYTIVLPDEALVADFNNDGNLDAMTLDDNTTLGVSFGSGTGSFGSAISVSIASGVTIMTVGDYNLDGIVDLALAGTAPVGIQIKMGRGDGTFGSSATYAVNGGIGVNNIQSVDFNNDGLLDLITNANGGVSDLLLGRGDGTFTAAVSLAISTTDLVLGESNNDGAKDLFFVGTTYVGVQTALSVASNKQQFFSLYSQSDARNALQFLNSQRDRIAAERGVIGAFESRLTTATRNLVSARENFDGAASRISDADVAQESAQLIRTRLLQQAASATLAQANQQPALALQLLT